MKISALSLVSLFFTSVLAQRERYIIMHPADQDPFTGISDVNVALPKTIMHTTEHDFTTANLTAAEADSISKSLHNLNGIVAIDELISLPVDTTSEAGDVRRNLRGRNLETTNRYLQDTPNCNATLDDVDFVTLDSLVYQDIPEFSDVKITYGSTLSGQAPVPCNPHGTEVASVIVGKTVGVIRYGNRALHNIEIFDCSGNGFVSSIIRGMSETIAYANANLLKGRRTVLNVSGGSKGGSSIVDAAATAVVKAGIPYFAAAGNYVSNACDTFSPARAAGVTAIGGTQPPGNVPAYFTNFDSPSKQCIALYLPGEVTVIRPNVNHGSVAYGTSFSSPMGAALGGLELKKNPKATPAQVQQGLIARSETINTPPGSVFDGLMRVMPVTNACPKPVLFKLIIANKQHSNKFNTWYPASNNNRFCVTFSAATKSGNVLIGLSDTSSKNDPIRIVIGKHVKKHIYQNTISEHNKALNTTSGNSRYVQKVDRLFRIEQGADKRITIAFNSMQGSRTIISALVNETIAEVSFSSIGGGVTYRNAIAC
jgi:hypothetical protein